MNAILKSIGVLLSNPKVQKMIIIALIIIAVLYLIGNANKKAKQWFQSNFRGAQGDNVYAPISDNRKTTLEQMASKLYSGIYGNEWNSVLAEQMAQITALPDNEIVYIDEYWSSFMSQNTLYYDVDWEIMPFESADDDLLAKLSAMNLQGTNTGWFG